MNYRMIKNVLGWVLLFEAAFMFVPAVAAPCFGEWDILPDILISIGICAFMGALLVLGKPKDTTLYSREGFVIVSLSWILISAFGALPFYISGAIPNYIDAFFETVSGFTTTGSSVIPYIEDVAKSLVLWRSFTNWIGGMGVLVFIMAFLPLSGATNMHIMKAESPGPSVSKLVPRVRTTALILYSIYFALTVVQFILLLCGGMTVFEALCTAFSTGGTGGFGVKNDSFFGFNSYIQIVVTVFMLLFSINFASYYLVTKKRFKEALSTEVKWFLIIVVAAIALITLNIYSRPEFTGIGDTIKHAAFTVASIISTTGFATVDFALWPEFSKGIILLLMIIGACAGSTGGGIKVSRIIVFFKNLGRELKCMLHPKQVKKVSIDKKTQEDAMVHSIAVYLICYVIIFVVSYMLLSLDPNLQALPAGANKMETNFSAVMSCFNNIGPGLGAVGPYANFSWLTPFSKLVLSFDMLAGRLELFPMLLLFHPATWKKT